jgi:hypothetical protein
MTFYSSVVGPGKNHSIEALRGEQEHLWFQPAQSVILPEGSSLYPRIVRQNLHYVGRWRDSTRF